jgi:diadenylate cyclase
MLRRIAIEVEDHVIELGTEGRLIQLQLEELVGTVVDERELLVRDYLGDRRRKLAKVLTDLGRLSTDALLDTDTVALVLGYDESDRPVTTRGYRLLSRIPRLPPVIIERLVTRFGTLPRLMDASLADLDAVEGIGGARARSIQDGLRRLAENSRLDPYG